MLDSKVTEGAAQAAQKKAEASPRRDDFVAEFGADTVKDLPNGEWEVNLEGIDKVRRYTEMMEGVRKIDIERGAEVNSRIESETMYDAQGRTVHAPVADAEEIAHKRDLHACRGMIFMTPQVGPQYVVPCDCGVGEHGPFRSHSEALRIRDALLKDGCGCGLPGRVESKWHS
jgi:hypothetical protein